MIRTENLTKAYNGVKAVDSVSLKVEKGEVFGFLGPNGSGKTTTIGMIVGLIEPTSGKCFINDVEVTRNPLQAKKITGYLPDGIGFYPTLTAKQNLKYFSRFYGLSDGEADKRIDELLDYVGLKGVQTHSGGFSRGMKQRLGLAQALINDPQVIFMDEPTNGLDPQGVVQFRNIISDLSNKGKTIFFSSHILSEVQLVCKNIGVISKGKIIAEGTTDEVRRTLQKDDLMTISVSVQGKIPELNTAGIVEASYNGSSAIIRARSDIRDEISSELYGSGIKIHELKVIERSLEEVFLNTVYGSV